MDETKYVTIKLDRGLGDRLLGLAFLLEYAELNNRKIFFHISRINNVTNHSSKNYFDTILKNFKEYIIDDEDIKIVDIGNDRVQPHIFTGTLADAKYICIWGYPITCPKLAITLLYLLDFTEYHHLLDKYPDISKRAYIHIRGGDYTDPKFIYLIISPEYYKKSIKYLNVDKYYLFTNDIEYAKTLGILESIEYDIIDEDEIGSLYLMMKCGIGGISANSTFSWWGAYGNRERELIFPANYTTAKTTFDFKKGQNYGADSLGLIFDGLNLL